MTKEERRIIAENHNEDMIATYGDEIEYCREHSKLYKGELPELTETHNSEMSISVVPMTSEEAVFMYSDALNTCLLNFASNTRAGGGFIRGAIAQEEALCHSSFLYNVLTKFNDHYNNNFKTKKGGTLYYDWVIYSPDVMFEYSKDTSIKGWVNVVTCPAPNVGAYIKCNKSDMGLYLKTLQSRIRYLLDVMELNKQKTLILGAFGCGVFGNQPYTVATIFKAYLKSGRYSFENVYFAIPPSENFNIFKKVFEND